MRLLPVDLARLVLRGWCALSLLAGVAFWPAARGAGGATMDPADLEAGRPFLQSFGLRDYHAHNQVWAMAQDSRGVLYFGNKNVVLEYDGVTWRKLPIGETTYSRGLAYDPATDAVFVGAVALIERAGPRARRALEFFNASPCKANTRTAYGQAVGRFLAWAEAQGLTLEGVGPVAVSFYVEALGKSHAPASVKQHLGAGKSVSDPV